MGSGPVRVAHLITRMSLGGAQENTLHTCDGLNRDPDWQPLLVTGPALGPEGDLLPQARRLGIQCELVSQLRRAINPLRDTAALVALVSLLRRHRPTIVQTHMSKAGFLGRIAARLAGVPIVVHTVEGLPFHRYAGAWANAVYTRAERLGARLSDQIVCVCRAMVDQAAAARVRPRGAYSVIYSGMDVDAFLDAAPLRAEARARFGLRPDDVVVGKVARLFELKGHEFLIRALPRILERHPNVRLLFVGDGSLRPNLERLARDLGVLPRIVFAGLVPPEDIPALVSAMDVLVHASLREGLARVLLQGLFCGMPVVAYALDGAPEVIIDGVTGRLVQPGSVEGLADAVLDVLAHPEAARRMAQEGRRRFADQFRIETMVEDTKQLYRRLLQERGMA